MQYTGILCESGELTTVSVSGPKIASTDPGMAHGAIGGPDVLIAPGLFDLQFNGYGGIDFNSGIWESEEHAVDCLTNLFDMAAKSGTALLLPTIVTNSLDSMCGSLRALDSMLSDRPDIAAMVPGVHVEGPYISSEDGPRGAHPLVHIRDPDYGEFVRLMEESGGRIKLFTLAPERSGAIEFIQKVTSDGVVVAIGHTSATPELIREAVLAGARMSTHLGNGAHSVLPRHPNYIWEQLACDQLYASIITDGHHLPPSVVKCIVRAKGIERTAIVSDAVALGGMSPGVYSGGIHEVLPGGKIVLAGTPYLAGAGHLLDTCVANVFRFSDLTIAQAALAASRIPANILGLHTSKGSVSPGYDADLTLFKYRAEGPLEIVATVCAGRLIYHSSGASKERRCE